MDPITVLALSVQNPILTAIGQLLDNDLVYATIVLGLVAISEWRNDKRLKICVSLALAFLLGLTVKVLVAEPRPCVGAAGCPLDNSFPSSHAVVAFTLMLGFLNRKSFPFFLIFALFVSFTRLNLGVHNFLDILGALPIALLAYYATNWTWALVEDNGWLKKFGITK